MDISGLPSSDNVLDLREAPKSAWEAMSRNRRDRFNMVREFASDTYEKGKGLTSDVLELLGITNKDTYDGVWGKPIDYSEVQNSLVQDGYKEVGGVYYPRQSQMDWGMESDGQPYQAMPFLTHDQPMAGYDIGGYSENAYEGVW